MTNRPPCPGFAVFHDHDMEISDEVREYVARFFRLRTSKHTRLIFITTRRMGGKSESYRRWAALRQDISGE